MIEMGTAHIITSAAPAVGDPAVVILAPQNENGCELPIESYPLAERAGLQDGIDVLTNQQGWTMTGPIVTIQAGHATIAVEREMSSGEYHDVVSPSTGKIWRWKTCPGCDGRFYGTSTKIPPHECEEDD